jgi:D-alanine transfer protein
LENLRHSAEWTDLELVLGALRDLGAEPLILSMPLNAAYYDYLGTPVSVRRVYYEKLRELARTYAVPVIDFEDHDGDKYFTIDSGFHLSRKGWIYYDRALDAFFHDRPAETEILEMSAAEQRGS